MRSAKQRGVDQVNLRLSAKTRKQLDSTAVLTGRTKSALAEEAISFYMAWRIPQQEELKRSIAQADRGEYAEPSAVDAVFRKYARR